MNYRKFNLKTLTTKPEKPVVFDTLGTTHNMELVMKYSRMWADLAPARKKRARAVAYGFGDQYSDLIKDEHGQNITEGQHIMNQGKVPIANNLIRGQVKTVIGQYNCLSPEQKATLENLNTTIVDINNRVIELETCCDSMDVTKINDIINSNNQKIEELETELNAGLENLRTRLELVENNPGSDTTILLQRIVAIENVIDVDLVYIKNRLLNNGDLHQFNIETQSRVPSAAVEKYIEFLLNKNI